jgi:hypothetical protein
MALLTIKNFLIKLFRKFVVNTLFDRDRKKQTKHTKLADDLVTLHCKKNVIVYLVPSRDVIYQTLPGRELLNYSRPEIVRLGTSRLEMRKTTITFFYSVNIPRHQGARRGRARRRVYRHVGGTRCRGSRPDHGTCHGSGFRRP